MLLICAGSSNSILNDTFRKVILAIKDTFPKYRCTLIIVMALATDSSPSKESYMFRTDVGTREFSSEFSLGSSVYAKTDHQAILSIFGA